MANGGVTVISLNQMVAQWLGASHKFVVNLTNAEANLALFAVETFKKSFSLKRFNSRGAPKWRSLKGKKKPTHIDLLCETGALYDSIDYKYKYGLSASTISVFTNPKYFVRERRNKHGKCFAAIHNSGGSIEATPGSKASQILQRQFMPTEKGEKTTGDSSYMVEALQKLHTKIFYGLPK